MEHDYTQLTYRVEEGAAWITLNRPEVLNSFSVQLYTELRAAIRTANLDDGVDILVLTGEGRAFGTGGDLKEFAKALNDDDPLSVYRFQDVIPFHILREIEKTTIAAVNGICVAAGLIAAMTCDIAIAGSDATFCVPEGKVGLADPFIPPLLFARVGMAKAKYLMFTAATIDAAEAERIGLVTETVPQEQLTERVRAVIAELRTTSPGSRATFKRMMNRIAPQFEYYDFSWGVLNPMHVSNAPGTSNERMQRLLAFSERPSSSHRSSSD